MKKLSKTKFKRIKKKRNRKFPKIFKYKSDNKPNLETKIGENPENKIKVFFPQNEFNLENCPEFQLGENISNDANNIQDFHFPLDFDLNMNDPNIQDDIIF